MAFSFSQSCGTNDPACEVSVLIPAYDCREEIGAACRSMHEVLGDLAVASFEILVIVNGPAGSARDDSLLAARACERELASVRVLQSDPPGKGGAIREGLLQSEGQVVFLIDCDLPYCVSFFRRALDRVREGVALVYGDRRHPASTMGIPPELRIMHDFRRALSFAFNVFVRSVLGLTSRDTQAGIKVMRGDFARMVTRRGAQRGFLADLEYFLVAGKGDFRVEGQEVHFRLRDAKSSIKLGRELRRSLSGVLGIGVSNALGRYDVLPRSSWAGASVSAGVLSGRFSKGLAERAFIAARWALTPYREMARYVPTCGSVVDIGCGHGLLSAYLALECPERDVLAVDHDEGRLSRLNGLRLPNVTTLRADMRATSLSRRADAILAVDCLHYLTEVEQEAFVRWAFENLIEGGTLIFREIDPESGWLARLGQAYERAAIASRVTKTTDKTFCVRTPGTWSRLLREAGFEVASFPCTAPLLSDRLFVARRGRGSGARNAAAAALVTADDWGFSPGVNEGILDLARRGIVRRVSVLPEAPFARYRMEELLSIEGIEIGLHASLTLSLRDGTTPDFECMRDLIRFLAGPRPMRETIASLESRFRRQLVAARAAGFPIAYADGHQHVHVFPVVSKAFAKVFAGEVPTVRVPYDGTRWGPRQAVLNVLSSLASPRFARHGLKWLPFRYPSLDREWRDARSARRVIDSNPGVEAIVHPAVRDDLGDGPVNDSLREERIREYRVLAECDLVRPTSWAERSWMAKPASLAFVLASAVVLLVTHAAVWAFVASSRGAGFEEILGKLDAGWFTLIAQEGYSGRAWAFQPAWPATLAAWHLAFPAASLPWVGAIIATGLFFASLVLISRAAPWDDSSPGSHAFGARSRMGILILLLSPASYVFHSNHTESLYLLLTVLACIALRRRRLFACAVACGFAALTKVQGPLLAMAMGLGFAMEAKSFSGRLRKLVAFGVVSGSLFALWLAYQHLKTGDALAYMNAQSHWHPPASLGRYFGALFLLNPEQAVTPFAVAHSVAFAFLLAVSVLTLRVHVPLALYAIAFLALEPLTGELVGTLRYATVLFLPHFVFGDFLARGEGGFSRTWLPFAVLAGALAFNLAVTAAYAMGRWAY